VWQQGVPHPRFLERIGLSMRKKHEKIGPKVLCSSKKRSIFAADFAAHVLLALMLMR